MSPFLKRGAVLALAFFLTQPAMGQMPDDAFTAFHRSLLTLDTHADVEPDLATDKKDPGHLTDRQVDLVKMEKGGLDAVFFIAYAPQGPLTPEGLDQARRESLSRLFAIKRMVEAYPERIRLAHTADEAEQIVATGKLAALIGVENGFPIGDSLESIKLYYDAGARYMGITHFGHNQLGDSSNPSQALGDAETRHGGLSPLGRQAIAEMNRLGIMVDVSHAAMTTTIEAARLSKAPIIASHSGVRGVADVARNLSDEALLAVRDNGGVAQMVALSGYVKPNPARDEARERVRDKYGLANSGTSADLPPDMRAAYDADMAAVDRAHPPATLADFIDHVDYAVKLAGIAHVGIASDFDGGGGVTGWMNAAESANVTAELLRRGYGAADIARLWGGNVLRVMREVEKAAQSMN